jgi:hypothetical protein
MESEHDVPNCTDFNEFCVGGDNDALDCGMDINPLLGKAEEEEKEEENEEEEEEKEKEQWTDVALEFGYHESTPPAYDDKAEEEEEEEEEDFSEALDNRYSLNSAILQSMVST